MTKKIKYKDLYNNVKYKVKPPESSGGGGTTYTAGDGLDLSGTVFSTDVKANGGLVIESTVRC